MLLDLFDAFGVMEFEGEQQSISEFIDSLAKK